MDATTTVAYQYSNREGGSATNTTTAQSAGMPAPDYLQLAQEAYQSSTNYFDSSIRKQVEANLRQFQGVHPVGSRYFTDTYRNRSKLFRPKTRGMTRKAEAVAAEAMFSTVDVVTIQAQNDANPQQRAAAKFMKALMEYRLQESIPWFVTAMGAYQDAMVVNACVSYQWWEYNVDKGIDRPCITLLALENFRFDQGADWIDPINTSPYLIRRVPMFVKDVLARMRSGKTGEGPKWKALTTAQILAAQQSSSDTTRQTRERGRQDSKEGANTIRNFAVVWCHQVIMDIDGQDMVWWTLGDIALLTDPVPIKQVWWHGKRPFVMGYSCIETHKTLPDGPVTMTRDVQAEINNLANLRLDNVAFTLNKRYFVQRNAQVDLRSLTRNVPGSATLVNDVEKNVKVVDTPDVTGSSFNEHDRLNVEFDDVSGQFSPSSVQSNRSLNETVGGMKLLNVNTNQVSAYQLKTWIETWVEPVLRQVAMLEAHYETDEVVMQLAADSAELQKHYMLDGNGQVVDIQRNETTGATVDGIPLNVITDDLMHESVSIRVDVGLGATNPAEKVNNFLTAMRSLKELLQDGILERYGMKVGEIISELFGNLGYRDGKRFFQDGDVDPALAAAQATIQQLQQELSQKVSPELVQAQVRKLDAEIDNLANKNYDIRMTALEKAVRSFFAAHQTGQMIAAVPQIAPVADSVLDEAARMSGNPPTTGQPVQAPPQALPGITQKAVKDPRTGIEFTPGDGAASTAAAGTAMAPDTTPNTPANPTTPASTGAPPTPAQPATPSATAGAEGGIETMRSPT
jgi:hypothetical protein